MLCRSTSLGRRIADKADSANASDEIRDRTMNSHLQFVNSRSTATNVHSLLAHAKAPQWIGRRPQGLSAVIVAVPDALSPRRWRLCGVRAALYKGSRWRGGVSGCPRSVSAEYPHRESAPARIAQAL